MMTELCVCVSCVCVCGAWVCVCVRLSVCLSVWVFVCSRVLANTHQVLSLLSLLIRRPPRHLTCHQAVASQSDLPVA